MKPPANEVEPARYVAIQAPGNQTAKELGFAAIRRELPTLPKLPGVYRMLDRLGRVLYVGKARNLAKRVASYAKAKGLDERILGMVRQTAALEIVTTHTEVEALLLEANLIKKLKPRYNVLLRDDKSFAYIRIGGGHDFPQISKYRGARTEPGEYFGPFASAGAVNQTLATFARAFPLRSCSDAEFARRSRPCLQYQIKRCSAPCVGKITKADYGALVEEARDFLAGRSQRLTAELSAKMQTASEALDFETAARLRDRIRALAHISARQDINVPQLAAADVVAGAAEAGLVCIQVFFFRAGRNLGNRAYFPVHTRDLDLPEVLAAFIGQFYENRPAPRLVIVSETLPNQALIAQALSTASGHKVTIAAPRRGAKEAVLAHALANAREALARRLAETATQAKLLQALAQTLQISKPLGRIEVFDNSHLQGAEPMGSMIVAGPEGFVKGAYRKFNIRAMGLNGETIAPGDDYAMMRQVLKRRFARLIKNDPTGQSADWPDLVLIDGGRGHLNVAAETLSALGLDHIELCAIAKGPDRDAGLEQLHMRTRPAFSLPPRDPVLYFLQRLRDEAHRFAISGHRQRRAKRTAKSALDEIAGIGPERKKALLQQFGSARAVGEAGLTDLQKVAGISGQIARRIYDHFHGG
jgi:excinuclease ABC subunit C